MSGPIVAAAMLISMCGAAPDGSQMTEPYVLAQCQAARIQADADHELLAWAEAWRIQAVASAEYLARQRPPPVATAPPVASATVTQPLRTAIPAPRATESPYSAPTSIEAALALTSWPRALWPTVLRIVACESGGLTTAVSPGGHRGLMQVDPRLHGAVPSDPVGQLEQAYGVYLQQGWGAWSCA